MDEDQSIPDLLLLGGPLHRLGCRLGLVRGGTNTLRLGIVLGLFAWVVLVLLAFVCGAGSALFSLAVVGVHVRLLVAIPLLFAAETWVAPRMTEFVREIVRSGIVPASGLPALGLTIRRFGRLQGSFLTEALLLLLAVALPVVEAVIDMPGGTGSWSSLLAGNHEGAGLTVGWHLGFCLPLFRFLMLRWLWRLGLWTWFLWRMQRLDLLLVPTHPDGAAGLGYLEVVQEHFAPLVTAMSAVSAASLAESIVAGTMAFEALYRLVPLVLALLGVLFVGPVLVFARKLWLCRVKGWSEYMAMASRYVEAFDRRWLRDEKVTGEAQLGTPDLQSLADLGNSVNVMRNMSWAPVSRRLVAGLTGAALLPMAPLLLLQYPLTDLAKRAFSALTGL